MRGKDKKNRNQQNNVELYRDFWLKQLDYLEEDLMDWHEKELKEWKQGKFAHVVPKGIAYLRECIEDGILPTASFLYQRIGYPQDRISMFCGCLSSSYSKETIRKVGHPIKMMRNFVAAAYEMDGTQKINPSFGIFMLKNLGMEDRQVVSEEGFTKKEKEEILDKLKRL
jgi:hypothetical protein